MNLKQKIIDKTIEAERQKTLQQFIQDPVAALERLLMRCGIQFRRNHNEFEISLNNQEDIIISVKKKAK